MSIITMLSMGWGVQSWTMAVMSAMGDLPPVDFAAHSDTGWERQRTYLFAEQWTPWLNERGVSVIKTSDIERSKLLVDPPFFTELEGEIGQQRRVCTERWKIRPIRRLLSVELKKRGLKKEPGIVKQWLGITLDEYQRMKPSPVKYIESQFPLVDLRMTRQDCIVYLENKGLPAPDKSACIFCPYHSSAYWKKMKQDGGNDWESSIKADEQIRNSRPPYSLFTHSSRKPLAEAVTIPEDHGMRQNTLFDAYSAPCDGGHCFL